MASIFEITARDIKTRARAGILETPHGKIQTPAFVPVGTQGTIKSLTPDDLETIGVQIFFTNTYHLYLRPGADIIEKIGGLHKFTGWDKPLMTDSGGFQVFSLAALEGTRRDFFGFRFSARSNTGSRPTSSSLAREALKNRAGPLQPLVKIDDNGVTFRSHLDGSLHRFTPEISIEVQKKLGADIILAFDDCPPYGMEKEKVKRAMERTHNWAVRSLKAFRWEALKKGHSAWVGDPSIVTRRLNAPTQLLFGIIQGGVFKDLREESAKFISHLALSGLVLSSTEGVEGFDGIAIGGVAVGESKAEMRQVLDWVTPYLPDDKPRHLLGVGEIDDLFEAVERGIDMFDCVMPTRLGRMGHILTNVKFQMPASPASPNRGEPAGGSNVKTEKWRVDITKAVFASDSRPLMEDCLCYTCQNHSRAYINHLFHAHELLAYRLATYHNLYFITDLMRQMREAIIEGRFGDLKKEWLGI